MSGEQHEPNSGPGWYEVIHPASPTTEIALVMEDGSIYCPEGVLSRDEFAFAAARGNVHRLVRADDAEVRVLPDREASARSIKRLSLWIDGSYPDGMASELVLRRRVGKLMEEVGEVGTALGGVTGENPRKGFTHSEDELMGELLDVAVTALGAWEHMDGNRGRSIAALTVKLDGLMDRVGLGAEPGSMMRAGVFRQEGQR